MAGLSDYAEDLVLNHILNDGQWNTSAENRYVALYTVAPTDAGGGTEVSGSGYTRVQVNAATWAAASSGSKSNGAAITFPQASGGNWGTVVAFTIMDASSVGNQILNGTVSPSQAVNDTDTASFLTGNLTIIAD